MHGHMNVKLINNTLFVYPITHAGVYNAIVLV